MSGVKTDEGRARRVAVFEFVQKFIKDNHYPPRTQDIRDAVGGMPPTTALWHLRSLRDQGYLAFEDGAVGRTLRMGSKRDKEAIE